MDTFNIRHFIKYLISFLSDSSGLSGIRRKDLTSYLWFDIKDNYGAKKIFWSPYNLQFTELSIATE